MANLPAQGEIVDCRCCPRLVVHLVAQILNGGAVFILHFADKIDECALGTPGASEHELAAWNLDGYRNEIQRGSIGNR